LRGGRNTPRGAEDQAIANTTTGQNQNKALYNQAMPEGIAARNFYTSELNNPQGFSPQQLSSMLTASSQSIGGSNAGAVGGGNQLAARTGNQAGLATTLDNAMRNSAKQLSGNALDIQGQNAALKQKQQQGGAQGLEALYGTNLGQSLASLGLSNQAIAQWINGANATNSAIGQNFNIGKSVASMAANGIGNLDTTGSSSGGEQVGNFAAGL